jgi:V8-like Glu-specific endopeptidase
MDLHAPVKKPKNETFQNLESQPSIDKELATSCSCGLEATEPSLAAERLLVTGKGSLLKTTPTHGIARPSSGRVPESIFGIIDDRVLINAPEKYPWRMICSLEIIGNSGSGGIGTGWFIGPKTLVTAGHCVYHPSLGGWAREITVYPGRYDLDDRVFPYPKDASFTKPVVSQNFEAVSRWINTLNPDFDYAVIHLDQPVGDETGWFSVAVKDDITLQGSLVNVSGYPGDKDFGKRQYFAASKIGLVTPTRIFYEADTYAGQSGAPTWILTDSGEHQVIGIHSYGVGGGFTLNSATRITAEIFNTINQWIKADA